MFQLFSIHVFSSSVPMRALLVAGAITGLASAPTFARLDDDSNDWAPKKTAPKPREKDAPAPAPERDKAPAPGSPEHLEQLRKESKELFKGNAPADAANNTTSTQGWSIVLITYRGENAEELAQQALAKVRTQGQLPDAFISKRREACVVSVGRFGSPEEDGAIAELKRVQALEIDGSKPYAQAFLAPPPDISLPGTMPQYNLAKVKDALGKQALYTLQIAVYGRRDLDRPTEQDLAEARKAAEQAVFTLRQEGEQAFYYHSRTMSMVTVGVFNQDDYDPQTPRYQSTRLREAQKRHPQNLYNGAGIREKRKGPESAGGGDRLQTSQLVAIPDR